ncbi:MAG: hypothetical protein ACI351_05905 [Candidatus Avelusimicrobium sp.]|uniref:hypothetical protein n=1 Tax=Candidatus Avelusimicrobium sp. TaxID=3048833 RepID=UPI003F0BF171
MNTLQNPEVLQLPFANNGQKNEIPLAQSDPNSSNASLTTGFPPITMKPKGDGGIPPEGKDFNGVLYLMSSFYFAFQNGWLPTFDAAVAQAIGGYAKGAILWRTAGESRQALQSQKNDNMDNFNENPDFIGTSWKAIFPDLQTILENMPIGLHVGDLLPNIGNEPPAGRMLCNGQRVTNCQTLYPEFYAYVLAKTSYKTVAEFNAQVAEYGQCGYPAVDGADVILPLITRPISGVNSVAQAGMAIHDTMRPITGTMRMGGVNGGNIGYVMTGAFAQGDYRVGPGGGQDGSAWDADTSIFKLDSSRLGANYSGSETRGKQVLYPYCVVVYTTIPDKATVDVDELVKIVKEENQLGVQTLPAQSGTIALKSGGIYTGEVTGPTVFQLPAVTDTSVYNQIIVQLVIANGATVDFGTTYYLGEAPSNTAGAYSVIYEYDVIAQKWAVGSLSKQEG